MLLKKKEEIEDWLNQYNIENYELIPDKKYGYVINVNNSVYLNYSHLKSIDIKFNNINGNFFCNANQMESLKGCPEIVNGSFFCSNNKLKIEGLKYLPKEISKNYIYLDNNEKLNDLQKIESFKELKEKINEIFNIKEEKESLLKIINKENFKKINNTNKI